VDSGRNLLHDDSTLETISRLHTSWHKAVQAFTALGLVAGMLFAATVPLQAQSTRSLHLTVSDPLNRFVTGLEQEHFEVVENGVALPIQAIVGAESPITIAIVSQVTQQPSGSAMGPNDVLIQTRSLADALQKLAASTNPRKTLILTTATAMPPIAEDIQVLRVDPSLLSKVLIEVRSQYVLKVDTTRPTSSLAVVVKSPRGLPVLQANPWKPSASN
jgi:hypothetical protein